MRFHERYGQYVRQLYGCTETGGIISEATLRWWDATGKGGPRSGRLGRRVVYRREDVQAWLDAAFDGSEA